MSRRSQAIRLALETLEPRHMLVAMPVGMNLENVKDYSPAWTFTDAFLESRAWVSQAYDTVTRTTVQDNTAASINQLGWPTALAQSTNAQGHLLQQQLRTDVFMGLSGAYAAGQYYAQWDGEGTLVWGGDAVIAQQGINAGGHHYAVLNVTPANAGIQLQITSMTTPVHDIHLWLPDYNGQSFVGQVWSPGANFSPFHPLFLQRLEGFGTLRFMQWAETDSSQIIHWSDSRPYNYARQGTFASDFQNGVSPEYMIELANELHADAWFAMPPTAADDYVTHFATLVRNTLDPHQKAYVEWANEVWNYSPGYEAFAIVQQQLALPQNAGKTFYQVWAADASHTFDLWTQAFAGQTNRLVRVVSGQSTSDWVTGQVLQNMHGNFDAIAIAPYISMNQSQLATFNASTTVDQVLNVVSTQSLPNALMGVDRHAALAVQYSTALGRHIPLLAYEGGLELIGSNQPYQQAFFDAGNDPRMYGIYLNYLQSLQAHGLELFVNYVYTAEPHPGPYGDNGVLHAMNEPLATAHRYRALLDFMSGTTTIVTTPVADHLVFSTQPTNAVAGTNLAAVTVSIVDKSGNLVSTSTLPVTLALGANSVGAVLGGTLTVSAVGGVARFTNLSLTKAATGYTLRATSGSLGVAISNSFNVTAAAAQRLVFVQQPTTATAGLAINPAVTVQTLDAYGNLASYNGGVAITLATNPTGATLGGTLSVPVVAGTATFSNVAVIRAATGYTLQATAASLAAATSNPFSIVAAAAQRLVFGVQPTSATVGAVIGPAVTVLLVDAWGNLATGGTAIVTIGLVNNPGGASLGGSLTVSAVGGVATFSNLSMNKVGAGYTLRATSGALSPVVSSLFNILPLSTTTNNSTARLGLPSTGIPLSAQQAVFTALGA
jgi:hypothetical protein